MAHISDLHFAIAANTQKKKHKERLYYALLVIELKIH